MAARSAPDERGSRWDFAKPADGVGRERIIFDDDLKDRIAYPNMLELIRQYNPEWRLPDARPRRRACIAPRNYGPWTRRSLIG